ncbi:hypothetical protein PG997_013655 [Apiospora hydei]|uniref:Uncharacterized protein n=1 Tax=Apiospora hydei TaxID=1337664 RepID=A0ABR1V6W0_9PEZI
MVDADHFKAEARSKYPDHSEKRDGAKLPLAGGRGSTNCDCTWRIPETTRYLSMELGAGVVVLSPGLGTIQGAG